MSYIDRIYKYIKVIVLVEINICEEENCLYNVEGFNSEFLNRTNQTGGGIAVFIKKEIAYERIKHTMKTFS